MDLINLTRSWRSQVSLQFKNMGFHSSVTGNHPANGINSVKDKEDKSEQDCNSFCFNYFIRSRLWRRVCDSNEGTGEAVDSCQAEGCKRPLHVPGRYL